MPGTAFGAKRRGGEGKTVRGGVQFSTANHDTAPRQTAHDLSVSVRFMLPRQNRGKTTVIHGKTAANLLELSRRTASGGVVEVLSRAAEPEVLGVIPKSTHAENFLK